MSRTRSYSNRRTSPETNVYGAGDAAHHNIGPPHRSGLAFIPRATPYRHSPLRSMAAPDIHEDEALGKAYDARLMRRLLQYIRPYRTLVAAAVVLLFADGALQLAGPWLTKQVIDVALPAGDLGMVRDAAVLFVMATLLQFAFSWFETVFTTRLGQEVMHDLRLQIFEHLQRLPVTFFDRNPAGRLITRVTSDVEALNELFTAGVVAGVGDLFTLIAISVMMLVVDWRLALASFAVIPLVYLTSHVFQRLIRETYREIRVRLARINSFLQERITGMRVVQLFGREEDEAARFTELNRSHLDAHLRSIRVYALYFPVIEILTTVALATMIVAGTARMHDGTVTIGVVAAFLQLLRRFFQPLQDLSEKYNILQGAMASSERIFALLDEPGARYSGAQHARPSPRAPSRVGVTVAFEDVWFAYGTPHVAKANVASPEPPIIPGASQTARTDWVLRGVTFRVPAGQTLALVGHTGAGKTTVISLLMRFYEPQRGRITIDGRDIRTIPLGELRSLMGYVQQDIFLFAADIRTNIRLTSPLTDKEVELAAARVGADRVIGRLPRQYEHVLGERGASISVGERQLLSFARAIAAEPALLLLDEATSAVDSEVEAAIQQALGVLMVHRTTIAVAHRLSTIVRADEILVMHHGEIRERGRHEELLAKGGLYERLYRLQGTAATALHRHAG